MTQPRVKVPQAELQQPAGFRPVCSYHKNTMSSDTHYPMLSMLEFKLAMTFWFGLFRCFVFAFTLQRDRSFGQTRQLRGPSDISERMLHGLRLMK